jgi:hypothetical protein
MARSNSILDDIVRDLGRERGKWPAIARAAEVSYRTIQEIAAGRQTNPTIGTVGAIRRGIDRVRAAANV